MSEKQMTECVVCEKEIEVMDRFNGEPMCQKCYHEPKNYVFEGDKDE